MMPRGRSPIRTWIVWGCICLLSHASGQNRTAEEDVDGTNISCTKEYVDRCLSKLPQLVDQSLLRRMPVSEKEIDSVCRGFQMGMQCINSYSNKCLEPSKKNVLEQQVSGARKVFNSLCNDESFRGEYLQHKLCLKGTQKNWESCVNQFRQLVREEIQKKNYTEETRIFQTCCAIHGFSRCIYVPGRLKCHKEAALFLLKIAEMSIDQSEYLHDCNTINYKVCAGSGHSLPSAAVVFFFLLLHFQRL